MSIKELYECKVQSAPRVVDCHATGVCVQSGLRAEQPAQQRHLSELEKDAANLLFALHDAWPYVHGNCTIESKKKAIQALMVKHGDFADLLPQPAQRKPLTPREYNIALALVDIKPSLYEAVTRAIEAAHNIKEQP